MILCTLAGYAAARFADVESGALIGLLAGVVLAPLVPLPAPSA